MGVFLKRAFVLSLVLHLLVFLVCRFALKDQARPFKPQQVTWIDFRSHTQTQRQTQKQKEPEHRVVQTESGEKVTEPIQSSFLGFQNQRVERQTVSRHSVIQSGEGQSSDSTQSKEKSHSLLKNLGMGLVFKQKAEEEVKGYHPEWATPGTRPQDSLLGIAESDRTALNTQEYVFYGYFQRIRGQLDRVWNPLLREKLISFYKQGRALASDQEHLTQLLVILDESGMIRRVQVVFESGVVDLDEAAVSAFKKAGPFPHPPKGMSDLNHEIKISWDFILKT